MPAASSYTTQELIGMISVLSGDNWPSLSEIKAELQSRVIPDDYPVVECRGGLRPSSQPLNP